MNLFLVPATAENLRISILRSVARDVISAHLTPKEITELDSLTRGKFHCWAMTSSSSSEFARMSCGDFVLFSEKGTGKFNYFARVTFKIDRESLGRVIWSFVPGKPWRLIYFLRDIEQIDVDKVRLVTELGYRAEYRVPGVTCVGPDRLAEVLRRYGSVEKLIRSLSLGEILQPQVTSPLQPPTVASKKGLPPLAQAPETFENPNWLRPLLSKIEALRSDLNHQERAHESLVEDFYETMGYVPLQDIKHRQGYIDISIQSGDAIQIVNEVKRDWGLSRHDARAVDQAYRYQIEVERGLSS